MLLQDLQEMAYDGNIGMMEMMKFYSVATPEEKALMKRLIASERQEEAWVLLKQVTGVKLK